MALSPKTHRFTLLSAKSYISLIVFAEKASFRFFSEYALQFIAERAQFYSTVLLCAFANND
jgi:hypothetical protein